MLIYKSVFFLDEKRKRLQVVHELQENTTIYQHQQYKINCYSYST